MKETVERQLTEWTDFEIAEGLFHGQLFTQDHILPEHLDLIPEIFLPLATENVPDKIYKIIENGALIIGRMDHTLPISADGYPVFFAVSVIDPNRSVHISKLHQALVDENVSLFQ